MKEINISPRLLSAADFVRQDAILADIGTDHAYLPLFLLKSGRIKRAVCSDINEGPLRTAMANAAEAGVADGIEFVLADGAADLAGRGITDVAICGMGGELISDIIDRAPFLKAGDVSLILQPMTRRGVLVSYLRSHGFSILREEYSRDAGKFYVTFLAAYTGEVCDTDAFEAEFGRSDTPCQNKEARLGYLRAKLASYEKRSLGVMRSRECRDDYSRHVEYIKRMIEEIRD